MPDVPKDQLVSNWMRDAGERLRAVERRYQELRQLIEGEDAAPVDLYAQPFQTTDLSGTTSGTTQLSLGTLVIPALPTPTLQIASLHLVTESILGGDRFIVRVRDTGTGGTVRGAVEYNAPASHLHARYPIPTTAQREVGPGTSAIWAVTVQRLSGTGTQTVDTAAGFRVLTVVAYPFPEFVEP